MELKGPVEPALQVEMAILGHIQILPMQMEVVQDLLVTTPVITHHPPLLEGLVVLEEAVVPEGEVQRRQQLEQQIEAEVVAEGLAVPIRVLPLVERVVRVVMEWFIYNHHF